MRGGCVSALVLVLYSLHGSFAQAQNKNCPELSFNGAGTWKNNGSYYQLSCPHYYHLLGPSKLNCTNGQWSSTDSICIGPRCNSTDDMTVVENGQVRQKFKGKLITVECDEGFETHQSPYVVCIHSKWNSTLPVCFPKNPALTCNVDEQDLCGWTQKNDGLEEWIQQSLSTPNRTQGYGPEKDHSNDGSGQYLYLDGVAEQTNDTGHLRAKIFSPIYQDSLSTSSCFSFWYHIFGDTAGGTLRLYQHFIGPEEAQSSDPILVEIKGDQGDAWRKQVVNLTGKNQSFQLVFEAESDCKLSSIIAIDDFNLGKDCKPTEKESVVYSSCKYRCVNESEAAKNLSCSCSISTCVATKNCCLDVQKYCNTSIVVGTQPTTSLPHTVKTTPIAAPMTKGESKVPPTSKGTQPTSSPITANTTHIAAPTTKEESKMAPPSKVVPQAGYSGLIITVLLLALVAIVAVAVWKRKQLQNRYANLRGQRVSLLSGYDNL